MSSSLDRDQHQVQLPVKAEHFPITLIFFYTINKNVFSSHALHLSIIFISNSRMLYTSDPKSFWILGQIRDLYRVHGSNILCIEKKVFQFLNNPSLSNQYPD